jgi:hypothetical protein
MRDEDLMRSRLRDYEGFHDDGTPILEPWQVPPIVTQSLPYLRPTGRTKMFNAVVTSFGDAGRLKDHYGVPVRTNGADKEHNLTLMAPVLAATTNRLRFVAGRSRPEDRLTSFEALTATLPAAGFVEVLRGLRWHPDYAAAYMDPALRFYDNLVGDGELDDFVIVWPQLTKRIAERHLPDVGLRQVVSRGRRQHPRIDFVGSDSKHRNALETIAGTSARESDPVAQALRDPAGRRGAALVYVAGDLTDTQPEIRTDAADLPDRPRAADLVVLLSLVAPATATPGGRSVVEWTVRRSSSRGSATVVAP